MRPLISLFIFPLSPLSLLVFSPQTHPDIFYSYNTYYVNYDNVNGIVPSSAVYLKGFKIGSVAKIKYEESTQKFCVSLQVDGDYKIPDNSMADIYATDIMGTKAVRILLGDNATPAKSYSYLQASITPLGLEFRRNDIVLGENLSRIYCIIKYPNEVDYGWYGRLTNIPGTVVSIGYNPLDNGEFIANLSRTIKKLLSQSLIELTIPESPNHPAQKFRLTERGKMFLELMKQ